MLEILICKLVIGLAIIIPVIIATNKTENAHCLWALLFVACLWLY